LNAEFKNESEKVELAKAYVALSNAHKLEFITPMFAADASYRSPNAGAFDGRVAIGAMMSGFFARFPDVSWDARNFRCTKGGNVQFDFEMTATESASGETIRRTGVEEIEFTGDGYISRLEVRTP